MNKHLKKVSKIPQMYNNVSNTELMPEASNVNVISRLRDKDSRHLKTLEAQSFEPSKPTCINVENTLCSSPKIILGESVAESVPSYANSIVRAMTPTIEINQPAKQIKQQQKKPTGNALQCFNDQIKEYRQKHRHKASSTSECSPEKSVSSFDAEMRGYVQRHTIVQSTEIHQSYRQTKQHPAKSISKPKCIPRSSKQYGGIHFQQRPRNAPPYLPLRYQTMGRRKEWLDLLNLVHRVSSDTEAITY